MITTGSHNVPEAGFRSESQLFLFLCGVLEARDRNTSNGGISLANGGYKIVITKIKSTLFIPDK